MLFSSCSKRLKFDGVVQFDASDPLALAPTVEWAVVTIPYAACYADYGYEHAVQTHFRRGVVLQVLGEQTVMMGEGERSEKWYAFSDGWMPESAVSLYTNKLRAESAARGLLAQ